MGVVKKTFHVAEKITNSGQASNQNDKKKFDPIWERGQDSAT